MQEATWSCISDLQIAKAKRKAGTTTGNRRFAECLRHSAKPIMHSAKVLWSAALGKAHTAKKSVGKDRFAECFLSGTRQSLCRVSDTRTLGKVQNEKIPKKFTGEAPTGQSPLKSQVTVFFA
jgi:hypothetical protein